jgi:tRNA pseudouridine38-40 synthase
MASPLTRRLAFGIEYDGTNSFGWQIQSHARSVQECLNQALSVVANEPVACVGAGRTDSGVHATGQVAHFDTTANRKNHSWLLGINSNLEHDINVTWVRPVPEDFHARFSATGRRYRFCILNQRVRSSLWRDRVWWVHSPLDAAAMAIGAAHLIGTHDFSAFRAAGCQSKSAVREFRKLEVTRRGAWIVIDCEANAFLHHMVRNIVGSLVTVGRGDQQPEWMGELLAGRDRKLSGITAPAAGLSLTGVEYPASFHLDDL